MLDRWKEISYNMRLQLPKLEVRSQEPEESSKKREARKSRSLASLRDDINGGLFSSLPASRSGGETEAPILSDGDHDDAVEPENTEQSRQLVETTRPD
jgi:hypothetical protein